MKRLIKLKYRGAPLSEAERKELNLKALVHLISLGIRIDYTVFNSIILTEDTFDALREELGFVGYAHCYLGHCYDYSELINEAEIKMYETFLGIDSELGSTQTEQLYGCVQHSVRMDLIKVTQSRYFFILKFKQL